MSESIGAFVRRATIDPLPARRAYAAVGHQVERELSVESVTSVGPQATGMERMFASPTGDRAVQAVGNEGLTLSIIGDFAVEALLGRLPEGGLNAAAGPARMSDGVQTLVVKSPTRIGASPAVLILDPDFTGDEAFRLTGQIEVVSKSVPSQFMRLLQDSAAGLTGTREHRKVAQIFLERGLAGMMQLLWIAQPEVLLARHPKMELLGCPSPALAIHAMEPGQAAQTSSVGIFCRDRDGVAGVTGCLHGTGPEGTAVTLGGLPSAVKYADRVQDLVFIPLPDGYAPPALKHGVAGIRDSRVPAESDPVRFEGCRSGAQATVVSSCSRGLLQLDPLSQNKVYTPAVANQGDSGSALVDDGDLVLGFAFRRTGYGEALEFAEWIWAANAMAALELKAY